jgi:hypothetical protein
VTFPGALSPALAFEAPAPAAPHARPGKREKEKDERGVIAHLDDITAPIGNGTIGPIEPTDNPND